ncbi:MAG: fimbrillin family protein [Mucinivorans sp.]
MTSTLNNMKYCKPRVIGLLMVALCAMACSKTTSSEVELGTTPIQVQAQMADKTPSKVSETDFEENDCISFYAVKYDGATPAVIGANAATYLNNKQYKRNGDLFKSWDGTQFVNEYYPKDGNAVDLYGISPYSATPPADFTAFTFAVKADQSTADKSNYLASDMLMAKAEKINPSAVPNKLIFNHVMAKIVVNVALRGFDSYAVNEVKIVNLATSAVVDLTAYDAAKNVAGKITSVATPQNVTPFVCTPATGFANTYMAILPAQAIASGTPVVEIKLNTPNEDKFTLIMAADQALVSGKEHIFNITVDFGQRPVLSGVATITPWLSNSATGSQEKVSENKFLMTLTNPIAGIDQAKTVKVGVNGNRTFTLDAKYEATAGLGGASALVFEFAGIGNRPTEYPFTITSFEALNASQATITGRIAINPAISIVWADRSETTPVGLTFNMSAHTITRP